MNLTEGLEVSGARTKLNISDGTKQGTLKGLERGSRASWDTKDLPEDQQEKQSYYKWTFLVKDDNGNLVDAIYTTSLKINTGGGKVRPSNLFKLLRALKPGFPVNNFKDMPLVAGLVEKIATEIPDGKISCLLSFAKDEDGYPVIQEVMALPV